MSSEFSPETMARMSEQVGRQLGLNFPPERWRELAAGLRAAARSLGLDTTAADLEHVWRDGLSRRDIEALARELTIGETYFFRDARTFDFLREQALPSLIARGEPGRRRLRIWSAGCCTGEEPYSVAILLDRYFPELGASQVAILGTDVNPRFLQHAATGVFSGWSFRDAPPWLKDHYFRPVAAQRYEVLPHIRARISFSYSNLAEGAFPPAANAGDACDLILCRNVLMYFTPERARAVIAGFHSALRDSGWLIVSAAETSTTLASSFTPINYHGATFYRKAHPEAQSAAGAPAAEPPAAHEPAASPTESVPWPASVTWMRDDHALGLSQGDVDPVPQSGASGGETPLSPTKSELTQQARACADRGDLAAALVWAERALSVDKLDASLHYLRALIMQEQGSVAEAVAGLQRTLYLDPEFVLAHFALGTIARRNARRSEALRHLANARRLLERRSPDDVLPHSDGLSVRRLKEAIDAALAEEHAA